LTTKSHLKGAVQSHNFYIAKRKQEIPAIADKLGLI